MQVLKSKDKITALQLFFLTFAYIYSGTLLFNNTFRAGREAWLAVITASIFGVLLMLIFVRLSIKCAEKNIFGFHDIMKFAFGNKFGNVISILYVLFFLILHVINLSDFGNFWHTVSMPMVSGWIFSVLLIFVCVFACQKGLTTIGRLSEILAILLPPIILILFFSTDYVSNLPSFLPFFENGIMPYLNGTFMAILTPFGDSIIFIAIFSEVISKASDSATPAANATATSSAEEFDNVKLIKKHKFIKTIAFIGGGAGAAIAFIMTTIRDVIAIGPHLIGYLKYPSDFSAQLIPSLNIEPLLDLNLSSAYAIKNILLLYGISIIIKDLFKVKNIRILIYIVAAVVISLTTLVYIIPNTISFLLDNAITVTIFSVFQIFLPIAIFFIVIVKKRFHNKH